jgi:sugar lactone lactonase YvrE
MKNHLPAKYVSALLAAMLLASCASQPHVASEPSRLPVWPPPPDEARIAYVHSIYMPRDIGSNPSMFTRLGHWITGENGANEALQKPFGLGVDESGNLCVTDTGTKLVCYLDFKEHRWHRFAAVSKIAFDSPVAVVRHHNLMYVADSGLGEVLVFGDNGKLVFAIKDPLVRPVGLAINGDSLAVVDSQAHAVFVFDLSGKFQFKFGKRGIGPGEFNFPTHISVASAGQWLVTDSLNCRIQIFSTDGNYISQFGSSGDTSGHFGRPKGVAADTFGHIYVADAVFDNVQIFALSGQLLLNFGQNGDGAGEFSLPNGIAIAPNNTIYIADGYNHRIQVFKYLGGQ